jgi:hypothetical protein
MDQCRCEKKGKAESFNIEVDLTMIIELHVCYRWCSMFIEMVLERVEDEV